MLQQCCVALLLSHSLITLAAERCCCLLLQFWLTYLVWFGLMKLAPGFYKRHRLPVVWLMRLAVLYTTEVRPGHACYITSTLAVGDVCWLSYTILRVETIDTDGVMGTMWDLWSTVLYAMQVSRRGYCFEYIDMGVLITCAVHARTKSSPGRLFCLCFSLKQINKYCKSLHCTITFMHIALQYIREIHKRKSRLPPVLWAVARPA